MCLIVKNGDKARIKAALAADPVPGLVKVLDLKKLQKSFSRFEDKRALAGAYDLFLADDRILSYLPEAIGTKFFVKKKQPVAVRVSRQNVSHGIRSIYRHTQMVVTSGVCTNVKVAHLGMSVEEMVENILVAMDNCAARIPKTWNGIQSISIKTSDSVALPIFNALAPLAKLPPMMKAQALAKRKLADVTGGVDASTGAVVKKAKKEAVVIAAPVKKTDGKKKKTAVAAKKKKTTVVVAKKEEAAVGTSDAKKVTNEKNETVAKKVETKKDAKKVAAPAKKETKKATPASVKKEATPAKKETKKEAAPVKKETKKETKEAVKKGAKREVASVAKAPTPAPAKKETKKATKEAVVPTPKASGAKKETKKAPAAIAKQPKKVPATAAAPATTVRKAKTKKKANAAA